jgi:hypothetical protein
MTVSEEAKARGTRLREIRTELAATLGYSPDQVAGVVKERIALAATLRLQHELTTTRLLAGQMIGTDELVKLTDAIAAVLPPPVTPPLEVRFVDSDGNGNPGVGGEEQRLRRECDEWRSKYLELARSMPRPEREAARSVRAVGDAAVLPFRPAGDDASWRGLAPEGNAPKRDGSLAVNAPLEQRYPNLAFDPPVAGR